MGLGLGGPSAGSHDPEPSITQDGHGGERDRLRRTVLSAAGPGEDEDHLFLYRVLNRQIQSVQAVLANATPESFRYALQESQLLTYRVEDPRHHNGFCTLLPWGYIFTCDHQPAEDSFHIYQGSTAAVFNSRLSSVHRQGIRTCNLAAPYVIHTVPLPLLAPWVHDQGSRILLPPVRDLEGDLTDFDLDGE